MTLWRARNKVSRTSTPHLLFPVSSHPRERRDEGIFRFVRYVSAAAPGSRWDVAAEFDCVFVEGGDDEDDGGEEDEAEEAEERAEERSEGS